ncbi:T9SS type A sorting domain-containing protein [Fluviicola sp.]|uniref:T9SS type A sorting domain-containing protein n=1 Tax=Fluviicola sp. TaxID=1917219 RepID=UPI0031D939C7
MKSNNILILAFTLTSFTQSSFGQCSGGSSFASVAAPTGTASTTISSCNWAGDYNTITGVVSGSTYTLTTSPAACITIHSGSPTGTVVAYGSSSVSFTAPSSGTYYMTLNANCTGCGTGTTCLTTTITCNSCGTGPCASVSNIPGCGQSFNLTTTGASSFISTFCSTSTPGLEQVYTYTATSTGNYSFNVTSVTGGGYAIGWKASSGGCSATGWTCAGIATAPGSVGTIALTSGTTYYFIMDATSTAASGITFSLTCPSGGPTVAGDCGIAANVCSNASFSIQPNGYGATNEICTAGTCAANPSTNVSSSNPGCLLSGELNSTWMIVNVLTGGTLTFQMGTPNSGTFNCLDWSMWSYTATTCASILAGTQAPVRCNYNGSCEQFTGLASALPTGATSMTNWESPITVGSYTQYLICLSNYSSAITTVPLSFGGTAVVSCSPLGMENVSLTGKNEAGYNALEWVSSSEFNADKYLVERSDDGMNYTEIGTVEAQGLSMESLTYQFEDLQPANNLSYYRVRLIRENGSSSSSNTLTLERQYSKDVEIVKTYPNPASEDLNIILASKTDASYELSLSNLNGQQVFKGNQTVQKGLTYASINVSDFRNGFYLLTVSQNGKNIATHKIVIE